MSFRMMRCLACELLVLEMGKLNVHDLHANTMCISFKVTNDDIMLCSAEGELSQWVTTSLWHLPLSGLLPFSVGGAAAILRVAPICVLWRIRRQTKKNNKSATSSLVAALRRFCATVLLHYVLSPGSILLRRGVCAAAKRLSALEGHPEEHDVVLPLCLCQACCRCAVGSPLAWGVRVS